MILTAEGGGMIFNHCYLLGINLTVILITLKFCIHPIKYHV